LDFFIQLFTDPVAFYQGHTLLIAQIAINSILALSIFVTLYSGQLALSQPGFMAIGAYTTVILDQSYHVPIPVGILVGCLLGAVIGFLVGLPVLRLRGVFLAIATIGFDEALRFGVILNVPITGEGQGLKNVSADPLNGHLPALVTLVVLTYVIWRLTGTKLGQAWAAIREDELAASSQGINVPAYRMSAFVLGSVIAALAGGLETRFNFFVDPTIYGTTRAVQILTYAVIGGATNVVGPIAGAVVLTALPEIVRQAAAYRDVIAGVILILIIVFRPQGIVGGGGLAIIRPRWWPAAWTLRRRGDVAPAEA
jgi:branched-chain amino acid transport system permease protein